MPPLHLRPAGLAFLIALTAAASTATCRAQAPADTAYPARPIRILVGFQPSGGSDIRARAAGQKLAERWNTPVVTDNRPGAGGTIAMEIARKAAADGYTLLVISGSLVTNATLVTRTPYDLRAAFSPITQLTTQPYVLLAHPALPAKTVRELVAYAKANSDKLNYASSGTGSSAHLGMELFKSMTQTKMEHIPYKGSGPALIDLLGGQVQLVLVFIPLFSLVLCPAVARFIRLTPLRKILAGFLLTILAFAITAHAQRLIDTEASRFRGVVAPIAASCAHSVSPAENARPTCRNYRPSPKPVYPAMTSPAGMGLLHQLARRRSSSKV